MINVSYASSDSFSWLMGVSIFSLLKNNSDEDFRIFILDNEISELNKSKIRQICDDYCVELNFIDISKLKSKIGNIKINEIWNFATFGRLFEAFLLPISIEKLLFIDCDTIVLGSVKSIYENSYDDYAIAGVKDAMSKHYFDNIGIHHDDIMFNAGILIMNLKYMRENDVVNRFLEKISASQSLLYLDQDIINCCIRKNEKLVLPLEYNFYSICAYCTYKEINTIRKPCNYYSLREFEDAKKNPIIIHFTTSNLDYGRPWNAFNNHPYRDVFLSYLKETPFISHELIKNKKTISVKIANFLPRCISFRIAHFIKAFIKPIFKKNK